MNQTTPRKKPHPWTEDELWRVGVIAQTVVRQGMSLASAARRAAAHHADLAAHGPEALLKRLTDAVAEVRRERRSRDLKRARDRRYKARKRGAAAPEARPDGEVAL